MNKPFAVVSALQSVWFTSQTIQHTHSPEQQQQLHNQSLVTFYSHAQYKKGMFSLTSRINKAIWPPQRDSRDDVLTFSSSSVSPDSLWRRTNARNVSIRISIFTVVQFQKNQNGWLFCWYNAVPGRGLGEGWGEGSSNTLSQNKIPKSLWGSCPWKLNTFKFL